MRANFHRLLVILTVAVMLFAVTPRPVFADGNTTAPLTLVAQSTKSDFKRLFTFSVKAKSSAGNIVSARLSVRFPGDDRYSVYQSDSFRPRPEISAQLRWDMTYSTMPPWQLVLYRWKLTDSAGNVLITPEETGEFEDDSHPWQKLSDGRVSLFYYGKSDAFAQKMLAAAQQAYKPLLKATGHMPGHELRLIIYNDQQTFCEFKARGDCGPFEGGVAMFGSAVVWIEPEGRDPGQKWLTKQGIAHELTHAFVQEWLGQRILGVPDWYLEGQAVNNQFDGIDDYMRLARGLVQNNRLFPLDKMFDEQDAPKTYQRLAEWYGEATSLVTFLHERWGVESQGKIMDEVSDYVPFYKALIDVTGLRIEEFEYQWRLWLKAPKRK